MKIILSTISITYSSLKRNDPNHNCRQEICQKWVHSQNNPWHHRETVFEKECHNTSWECYVFWTTGRMIPGVTTPTAILCRSGACMHWSKSVFWYNIYRTKIWGFQSKIFWQIMAFELPTKGFIACTSTVLSHWINIW